MVRNCSSLNIIRMNMLFMKKKKLYCRGGYNLSERLFRCVGFQADIISWHIKCRNGIDLLIFQKLAYLSIMFHGTKEYYRT